MWILNFLLIIALFISVSGINYHKPFAIGTLPNTFESILPPYDPYLYEIGLKWKGPLVEGNQYYNNCPAICENIVKDIFGSSVNRAAGLLNFQCRRFLYNRMSIHCEASGVKLCASYSPEEEAERLVAGILPKNDGC